MFDKGPKASWERSCRGQDLSDRPRDQPRFSHFTVEYQLVSWFLRVNFWPWETCQRRKRYPTAKPSRRPAPPLLASLSSPSEGFLSWAASPRTGTLSGLSVLTPLTSSSPPTPKQVLRQLHEIHSKSLSGVSGVQQGTGSFVGSRGEWSLHGEHENRIQLDPLILISLPNSL